MKLTGTTAPRTLNQGSRERKQVALAATLSYSITSDTQFSRDNLHRLGQGKQETSIPLGFKCLTGHDWKPKMESQRLGRRQD